ncbi:hypothetical protein GQX74_004866, partial [Glossina fuscipes]
MAAKTINKVEIIAEGNCKNSAYGSSFLDGLNKMRVEQKYCDFTLEVDGDIVKVHKVAVAIGSPYFARMLENDMEENRAGTVKLEATDLRTIKALIEYVYTGIITLTEDNVEALLSASDRFQIEWVKLECEEYVKRNLNPANCLRILKLCDTPTFTSLYDSVHNYIVDHFDDLIEVEDLLLLSFDEIEKVIKDNQLNVKSEDNVYKAMLNWVKHDANNRKVHLAELMSHITLPLLSTQFLKSQVSAEPMLTKDPRCNELLVEALFYKLTSIEEGKPLPDSSRTRKRTEHINEMFHVFLVGGYDDTSGAGHRMCKVYDISKNKLVPIAYMNEARYYNPTISLNGAVYSVGGYESKRTAECYDPVTKRWNYIASMNYGRRNCGICTHNDLIYVVAGLSASSVENYNAATDLWHLCANIPAGGSSGYTRSAVVENNIYSVVDMQSDDIKLCFRLDPREGRWDDVKEMVEESCNFDLVSYGHSLFFIANDCCKRLDVRMNKWHSMPSPQLGRYGFSAVIAADEIYMFGGRTSVLARQWITSVERFNIRTNVWTTIESMEIKHAMGGAAVVSGCFDFDE